MILTFIKRFLLVCALLVAVVITAVTVCVGLACSQPGFYAAALAEPLDEADVAKAMEEIDSIGKSLELFVNADPEELEKLRDLVAMTQLNRGDNRLDAQRDKINQLVTSLKDLETAIGETPETFAATLTQRHLNAWMRTEMKGDAKELQRPCVSLQDDLIRFGVTVITPVTEAVLSCDFKLAKQGGTDLIFELHAARIGNLPVPAATILRQYARTNPTLPKGMQLNVDGECPTLTITAVQDDAKLQVSTLQVHDGEVHVTLRRTEEVG